MIARAAVEPLWNHTIAKCYLLQRRRHSCWHWLLPIIARHAQGLGLTHTWSFQSSVIADMRPTSAQSIDHYASIATAPLSLRTMPRVYCPRRFCRLGCRDVGKPLVGLHEWSVTAVLIGLGRLCLWICRRLSPSGIR